MKIGLTGGTGFIGQYLIRDYRDKYEFVAASSKPCFDRYQKGAHYMHSDYSKDSFKSVFSGCDAVIHMGAHIPQQVKQLDSIEAYLTNITVAENVFAACCESNIKNIIDISSVAVYDKLSGKPYKESDETNPSNVYGITKLAVEKLAHLYNIKKETKIKSLRVSQVLGYRDNMESGFYSMLFHNAKDGKPITVYGEGKAARDYIYVKDVNKAIIQAIEASESVGIFNISMGKSTSNTELAKAYAQAFNNGSKVIHIPVDHEDDSQWEIDISKARAELGFNPQCDLVDIVTDMKLEMQAQNK